MTIDVSQFLAVFFAESFQGLADMDAGLRQIQPGEVDRETLNGVFRAAHSIKGGAATFGLPEIAEFTHPLETLLSEIRDGTRTMTGESHAVLLSSVDCLLEMFEAKRNDRPIDEQAVVSQRQRLQVVLTAQHGTAVADLADRTRSVPAARVWRIEFRPERRSFTSGQDPLLVLRELARFGETRAVADFSALPGLQELDAHNCYLSWSIEQKSDVSRNAIDELFASAGNSGLQIEQITTPSDAECDTFTGEQGRSTRVSVEKIESLVNLANELVVTQSKLSRFSDDLARSVIQAMQEIGSSSGKIAEIVNVIDEVVSQTNLLALNATLEAARSGEQGRGLSVVATEVRNLARRSATAAGQIKDLIEDNVENANASAELAGNAGAAPSPDADATWDAALSESQPVHYDLGRTLTLDNVEVARQHFEDLLGTEREVCLEGGELTSIDTAGLQCLCALLRGRSAGNASFSWASASLQLREAVRLTGCADLLRMPL